MSIIDGVRAAAKAYHEETGAHLDMIVLDGEQYEAFTDEMSGKVSGVPRPDFQWSPEITSVDDVIVTTRKGILR